MPPSHPDTSLNLDLAPATDMRMPSLRPPVSSFQGCSYRISRVSQAFSQVFSMLSVLVRSLKSLQKIPLSGLYNVMPWVIDTLLQVYETQELRPWEALFKSRASQNLILRTYLDVYTALEANSGVESVMRHKVCHHFVLICAKVLEDPSVWTLDDEFSASTNRNLSLCLLQLANSVAKNKSVAQLMKSQLLEPLGRLFDDAPQLNLTDLRVSRGYRVLIACGPRMD